MRQNLSDNILRMENTFRTNIMIEPRREKGLEITVNTQTNQLQKLVSGAGQKTTPLIKNNKLVVWFYTFLR
jgi:hypothetical protein